MYLYASEHALMDWHFNTNKIAQPSKELLAEIARAKANKEVSASVKKLTP